MGRQKYKNIKLDAQKMFSDIYKITCTYVSRNVFWVTAKKKKTLYTKHFENNRRILI